MKVTYYGHACFAAQVANKTLLFDPFITGNELAKAIDVKTVPADYILISHGHADHLADAAEIAKRTGATIVSNYEVTVWFNQQGLPKTHPLNHGGGWGFDFGRVKFVNAIHSSSLPDGTYGGNPGGFVVESADGNFYYSGDTALTMDMKLIGESTRLAFAALPSEITSPWALTTRSRPRSLCAATRFLACITTHSRRLRLTRLRQSRNSRPPSQHLHLLVPGESHVFLKN